MGTDYLMAERDMVGKSALNRFSSVRQTHQRAVEILSTGMCVKCVYKGWMHARDRCMRAYTQQPVHAHGNQKKKASGRMPAIYRLWGSREGCMGYGRGY